MRKIKYRLEVTLLQSAFNIKHKLVPLAKYDVSSSNLHLQLLKCKHNISTKNVHLTLF